MLLKGRNKPYEEILDPLYDIARKERYEDEELADIKITMKWLGERLKVNTPLNTKNSRNRKKPFREHLNQYVTAYQMTTLSSSGRNMAPSVMPKAS